MATYIVNRLIQAAVVIWIVVTVVFFLVRLSPGDPALQLAGPDADKQTIDLFRQQLGLRHSLPAQYGTFVSRVVELDFGKSLRFGDPALRLVLRRFPATLRLTLLAFAISVGIGGLVGIASAVRPGGLVDTVGKFLAILGQSFPSFWIGLLLILLFSVRLRWLPTAGDDGFSHYVLPAITLGWFSMAAMVRVTRSAMVDSLDSEYVRMLRAKGLSEKSIVYKHALRNASIVILTLASLQFATFLSASVLVETIFAWPGVGRLMVESVRARDYTVVQSATFVLSTLLVLVNMLVDLSYTYIDPRIRYE